MEKSPIWIGNMFAGGQTGVSLAKKEEHIRQRRALAPDSPRLHWLGNKILSASC